MLPRKVRVTYHITPLESIAAPEPGGLAHIYFPGLLSVAYQGPSDYHHGEAILLDTLFPLARAGHRLLSLSAQMRCDRTHNVKEPGC